MAHKVMDNGTFYEITGGKINDNGTVYEIDHGKVNDNGTVYEIAFVQDLNVSYTRGSGRATITIDGINYDASFEMTVKAGTTIKVALISSKNYGYNRIYLNGTIVAGGSTTTSAISYEFTATADVTITSTEAGNMLGKIYVSINIEM